MKSILRENRQNNLLTKLKMKKKMKLQCVVKKKQTVRCGYMSYQDVCFLSGSRPI